MAANPNARELELRRLEPQPQPSSEVSEPQEPAVSRISTLAEPAVEPSSPDPVPGETNAASSHEEIARAAYFLAEARGFEPGHELDDWLTAEQQVGSA